MSTQPHIACITCELLGECPTVDEEKLKSGYYCGSWRETHQAIVMARQQILQKFGAAGVRAMLDKPPQQEGEQK